MTFKAELNVYGGKMKVEFEAANIKEVWEQAGKLQEVFTGEPCGKCKCPNTRFFVREVEVKEGKKTQIHKYYELRCTKCWARLSFGQSTDTENLFPKRKEGDEWLPDNGWLKYNPETKKDE